MHRAALVVQEPFYEARMEFEDLIEQLLSPVAADLTHSQAEDLIERQGREVLRQLLQGSLAIGPEQVHHVFEVREDPDIAFPLLQLHLGFVDMQQMPREDVLQQPAIYRLVIFCHK